MVDDGSRPPVDPSRQDRLTNGRVLRRRRAAARPPPATPGRRPLAAPTCCSPTTTRRRHPRGWTPPASSSSATRRAWAWRDRLPRRPSTRSTSTASRTAPRGVLDLQHRISAGGIRAAGRLPRRLPGAPLRGPRSRLPRLRAGPDRLRAGDGDDALSAVLLRGWIARAQLTRSEALLFRRHPERFGRSARVPPRLFPIVGALYSWARQFREQAPALLRSPAGSLGSAPWRACTSGPDRHEHRAEKLEPVSVRQYYEHYWSEEGFNPIRPTSTRLHTVLGAHLRGSEQCLDVGCGDGRRSDSAT